MQKSTKKALSILLITVGVLLIVYSVQSFREVSKAKLLIQAKVIEGKKIDDDYDLQVNSYLEDNKRKITEISGEIEAEQRKPLSERNQGKITRLFDQEGALSLFQGVHGITAEYNARTSIWRNQYESMLDYKSLWEWRAWGACGLSVICMIGAYVIIGRNRKAKFHTSSPPESDNEQLDGQPAEEKVSMLCNGCGVQLPEIQVREKLGNPKYSKWSSEGYCSFPCYEKNKEKNKVAGTITS